MPDRATSGGTINYFPCQNLIYELEYLLARLKPLCILPFSLCNSLVDSTNSYQSHLTSVNSLLNRIKSRSNGSSTPTKCQDLFRELQGRVQTSRKLWSTCLRPNRGMHVDWQPRVGGLGSGRREGPAIIEGCIRSRCQHCKHCTFPCHYLINIEKN